MSHLTNPELAKFMLIFGIAIVGYNVIQIFCRVRKIRCALTSCYQLAEKFHVLALGCAFIAFASFLKRSPIVGAVVAILAIASHLISNKFSAWYEGMEEDLVLELEEECEEEQDLENYLKEKAEQP